MLGKCDESWADAGQLGSTPPQIRSIPARIKPTSAKFGRIRIDFLHRQEQRLPATANIDGHDSMLVSGPPYGRICYLGRRSDPTAQGSLQLITAVLWSEQTLLCPMRCVAIVVRSVAGGLRAASPIASSITNYMGKDQRCLVTAMSLCTLDHSRCASASRTRCRPPSVMQM